MQAFCLILALATQVSAEECTILTVDQCIESVIKKNTLVGISEEHISQAQFRDQEARAGMFPTVSSNLYGAVSTDVPVIGIEGRIEQPLFLGGQLFAQRRKTQAQVKLSQEEKILSQVDLAYAIRDTFFEIKKTEADIQLLQEEIVYFKKVLDADQRLVQAEYRTQASMLEHAVMLGEKERALLAKEKQLEFLYDYLMSLTGLDKNKSYVLEDVRDIEKDGNNGIAHPSNEPLLASLDLKINEAQEDLNIAKSERFPKVHLVGKYRREKDSFYDKNAFEAGVLVHWNIWDFGRTTAEINQMNSKLTESKLRKETEIATHVLLIKKAMNDLAINRQSIAIKEQVLDATQEKVKNLKIRHIKGDISDMDMADMNIRELKAKTELVSEIYNYHIAEARVFQAIGVIR